MTQKCHSLGRRWKSSDVSGVSKNIEIDEIVFEIVFNFVVKIVFQTEPTDSLPKFKQPLVLNPKVLVFRSLQKVSRPSGNCVGV
jgi:hypothetical protein